MFDPVKSRTLAILSYAAAGLAMIAAMAGLCNLEMYRRLTPDHLMPGTMSQDLVSLLSALGVMLALTAARRGSRRAGLIWLGLTGYLMYAYGIYAFDRLYTPLFPVYIAILGLCIYAIIMFFIHLDPSAFLTGKGNPPRRTTAVYFLILTSMFLMLWMSQIIPGIRDQSPPPGNSIFVMDLAFFLPLLTTCAVLLFRKNLWGDLLAAALLVKMGVLGFSVLLGALLAPLFSRPLVIAELGIYAFLGLGGLALAGVFLAGLKMRPCSAQTAPENP